MKKIKRTKQEMIKEISSKVKPYKGLNYLKDKTKKQVEEIYNEFKEVYK